MLVTRELLTRMGASAAHADRHLDALNAAMAVHGIDTELRIAHFLAQVMHESGCLRLTEENLNYSAEGLRRVFRKYYRSDAEAAADARQPERIANRVYASRMGNGPESSGDGYRYRGRGLIQLTGKENYRSFAQWCGADVVANPGLGGRALRGRVRGLLLGSQRAQRARRCRRPRRDHAPDQRRVRSDTSTVSSSCARPSVPCASWRRPARSTPSPSPRCCSPRIG